MVTVTSVGYGDVAPKNKPEMQVATIYVLLGSAFWAYIIGNACGIIANLDVEALDHHQLMEQLNFFMRDRELPDDLQRRLRAFFRHRKSLAKNEGYKALTSRLSPALLVEVRPVPVRSQDLFT